MKKILLEISCLVILLNLISGCSTTSDCTVLSSKVVRLNEFELDKADRKQAHGESIVHTFLFIPDKAQPNLKEALDNALEAGGGDVMTDARLTWRSWWFIYGETGWSVDGNVSKTRK